jgi:hypothetical protein
MPVRQQLATPPLQAIDLKTLCRMHQLRASRPANKGHVNHLGKTCVQSPMERPCQAPHCTSRSSCHRIPADRPPRPLPVLAACSLQLLGPRERCTDRLYPPAAGPGRQAPLSTAAAGPSVPCRSTSWCHPRPAVMRPLGVILPSAPQCAMPLSPDPSKLCRTAPSSRADSVARGPLCATLPSLLLSKPPACRGSPPPPAHRQC